MRYKVYIRIREKPLTLPRTVPIPYAGMLAYPAIVVAHNKRIRGGFIISGTNHFVETEFWKTVQDVRFPKFNVRGGTVFELSASKGRTLREVLKAWMATS